VPDAPDILIEEWRDGAGTGAAFFVKAHAGGRRDAVGGVHDGMLKVEVTTAPEKGKANKAIAKLLAKALGVGSGSVVLLSGETSQRKRFGVRGTGVGDVRERLKAMR
jgi:uncharacterized protein YggU (UPF0235/DUF167 family)